MSVYVQYTPYALREGDWSTRRDEVADVVLRTLEEYAPGICAAGARTARCSRRSTSRRPTGSRGGHPFHGEPSLDQLFVDPAAARLGPLPLARCPGLYLCGAGTHPGGGVTGGPGANAAREILKDLK